jgi:hypothetical protein
VARAKAAGLRRAPWKSLDSGGVQLPELGEVEVDRWSEGVSGEPGRSELVDADGLDGGGAGNDEVPRARFEHQTKRPNSDGRFMSDGQLDLAMLVDAARQTS